MAPIFIELAGRSIIFELKILKKINNPYNLKNFRVLPSSEPAL
jgi:hypothetical protein